jgi:hypothetical protein
VSTDFEDLIRIKSEHLADLRKTTAEVEREISNARDSMQREFEQSRRRPAADPRDAAEACQCEQCQPQHDRFPGPQPAAYVAPRFGYEFAPDEADLSETARIGTGRYQAAPAGAGAGEPDDGPDADRTTILINKGRSSAYRRKVPVSRKMVIAIVAAAALLVVLVLLIASGGGATWPVSVARVQTQIEQACRNPNVASEPGQVNFACAKGTRQILWVFSLITSDNNPSFADSKSGRQGLEPITPGQGGQVAAALNLHHPYDPSNPIDSIQVAARAINSIIGGATVTGASGSSVIQPGLEGTAANCLRYTGSAALTSQAGFPPLCARPLSGLAGQGALVADVYQRWMVGAAPGAAQDAAVLFENSNDPGNAQVQAILRQLPDTKHSA